ncbi:hypothetical protein E3U43_016509 [Larimichthys crocea]|uniref:Uncharacterized protein n=1 Tax=Larimichthys crocea TaxID=215358 RepID=A0ACD3QHP9_LARCR|nr:hypothetical protein E3U43_016509 [Larimichthys crocea]
MGSEHTQSTSNESRCVFFNTDSEDHRCAVILTVKRATGTFSLGGCVFMLFVIWLLRRYHSLAQVNLRCNIQWYVPLFSLIFLMICCYARIICVANERVSTRRASSQQQKQHKTHAAILAESKYTVTFF